MEVANCPHAQKQNLQASGRKVNSGSQKDLWLVVRDGSLNDVESALASLKKSGGNINLRNTFGLTPLHVAAWRNHIPIVRRLLAAGADPDARDGESGWSSLHRALHFGHLAVASILLQHGASITLEDSKSRIPVDLLSGNVFQVFGNEYDSVATEVFSWGSGANYQLGTGNAHIQKLPCKVDSLNGSIIKLLSAAKFHSVALTDRGEVYTWGFGRGGRLGHPDFDIHSGQAAVITPRQVTSGLGSRRVMAIAAAKHHTVIATQGGEVFTWGSNREGQLGYTSVDTQPTARRVSLLKSKIVAVAAANKHTAVVSDLGEVFTWGGNREGQLGYGTSNSASNYTPHVVESLKGKILTGVSAAKYHTIVLGSDGEVFTWGHRLVTPKRVVITRNLKKSGSTPLKFHRKERLHVVSIAAGMVHSMALTEDGALFYWVSSDPDLRCQQLYAMCGRNMVSISAGKYWTAAATATGDVYMWDGKKGKDKPLVATRMPGVKKATSVSVGETHLLIVASLYHPVYPIEMIDDSQKLKSSDINNMEEFNEDILFEDTDSHNTIYTVQNDNLRQRSTPSLKSLCEKAAAECLLEPRNAIQLLEIADSLGADDLKKYCEDIVMRNLDYIFSVSSHAVASASLDILASLEGLLDQRSSEAWSYRRLPTPTAILPVTIDSEEEDEKVPDSAGAKVNGESGKKGYVGIHSSRFRDFLLKPELLRAIVDSGFEHPSEVQHECIPQAIWGMGVLCQAKSGMGKTVVFVLSTLQQIDPIPGQVSALILCHTRELAYQICHESERFSTYLTDLKVVVFYVGVNIKVHKDLLKNECPQIVVGTPGRILALSRDKDLSLKNVRHFILDECDKMLESLDMRKDVQDIFKLTPHDKQVMMFSATLSKEIRPVCKKFMQDPMEIYVDDEAKLTLHGLVQHYIKLKEEEKKPEVE